MGSEFHSKNEEYAAVSTYQFDAFGRANRKTNASSRGTRMTQDDQHDCNKNDRYNLTFLNSFKLQTPHFLLASMPIIS